MLGQGDGTRNRVRRLASSLFDLLLVVGWSRADPIEVECQFCIDSMGLVASVIVRGTQRIATGGATTEPDTLISCVCSL